MPSYKIRRDEFTKEHYYETILHGRLIADHAILNKGTAFSKKEREELGLYGLLPAEVSNFEIQIKRTYTAFQSKATPLEKHIFLRSLQDRNETLFYRLLAEHIEEMLPIVYTPTVGEACQRFHEIYRKSRGLFISYPDREKIDEMLANIDQPDVKVIVVTDGERILGLGDQGAGGMGISIGKTSLYTACGGIHPAFTLPIVLDVGTDNQERLDDPLYFGWRNRRIRGRDYEQFVEKFIQAVLRKYPNVLLQWEDFGKEHAYLLLNRYADRICSFNDDIQGTAAVTLAGILAAVKTKKETLRDQKVVFLGAGSAGVGIAEQIVDEMVVEGLTREQALERIWMVDRQGLLVDQGQQLLDFQKPFVKKGWRGDTSLEGVVEQVAPTVLVGVSASKGAFTESIVKKMHKNTQRPIIFPLSNPLTCVEAEPKDLLEWTNGQALVATGTRFPDVIFRGQSIAIGQCNNVYVFPGMGLGVISSGARKVSSGMFRAAAHALSEVSPALSDPHGSLFPYPRNAAEISKKVALAVAKEAQREGLAPKKTLEETELAIEKQCWLPRYCPIRCTHSIQELKRKLL